MKCERVEMMVQMKPIDENGGMKLILYKLMHQFCLSMHMTKCT